ncbi:arginase family protein [Neomoorella carbonis]|uniref:arginase family protein n=1 Tax=Neomoorella carbonis TaxID=3062783 RepID=UPI0032505771
MFIGSKVITLLNFDDTLTRQEELRRFPYELIDLRDIKGTRLYCGQEALAQVAARLGKGKRGITFIGSGDFHYVSYLLAASIACPFTLILFDHHIDLQQAPQGVAISCGSWVARALELPTLQKAIIIGPRPVSLQGIAPHYLAKLVYLPCARLSMIRQALKKTAGTVYISIDKDVLSPQEAITNWEQGSMTLGELLPALREITRQKNVAGADVCGEPYLHPLDYLRPAGQEAIRKNARANIMILQTLLSAHSYKKAS